jgi:hypothetical protein
MKVRDFPAVVTMDSHGHSLHQVVSEISKNKLQAVLEVVAEGAIGRRGDRET